MTDLLALTAELCAVPSPSLEEHALADLVQARLAAVGRPIEVRRDGPNVVARTRLGRPRRIILGGHLDTVPPDGNLPPRREGNRVVGVGAADMKGGLAVMLALAAEVAGTAPRFDLTFVFYAAEEIADEHNGLRHLFAAHPDWVAGDLAVLLEPTGGWVEAGCQGTLHLEVTYRGRRAHTARPWTGRNAIHRLAAALTRVAAYEPEEVVVDGLRYREALQAVRVTGGVANNVVPDAATLVVNRRFAPARTVAEAVADTEGLFADADERRVLTVSPAAPPMLGDPLVAELIGRHDLGVRPKLGWTDVARFAASGVPALNFGPGDPDLAHRPDEAVDGDALAAVHAVLAAFLGLGGR